MRIPATSAALLVIFGFGEARAETSPKIQISEENFAVVVHYAATRALELLATECETRYILDASANTSKFWHVRSKDSLSRLSQLEAPDKAMTLAFRVEKFFTSNIKAGVAKEDLPVALCEMALPKNADSSIASMKQFMKQ